MVRLFGSRRGTIIYRIDNPVSNVGYRDEDVFLATNYDISYIIP